MEKNIEYISGKQIEAVILAFSKHKLMSDLPDNMKELSRYRIRIDINNQYYIVWLSPEPLAKELIGHSRFSRGYVINKKDMQILKIVK